MCKISSTYRNDLENNRFELYPIHTFSCLGISDSNHNAFYFECCGKLTDVIHGYETDLTIHTNHYLGCGLQFVGPTQGSSYQRYQQLTNRKNRNKVVKKAIKMHNNKQQGIQTQREIDGQIEQKKEESDDGIIDIDINHKEKSKKQFEIISIKENYDIWICKVLLTNYNIGKWKHPVLRPYITTDRPIDQFRGRIGTVCSIIMDLTKKEMFITRGNPMYSRFFKVSLDHVFDENGTQTLWVSKM